VTGPVLVIGGYGFLGRGIAFALREAGREPVLASRTSEPPLDLLDGDGLKSALDRIRPTEIICAAGVSSVTAANADPGGCFRTGVTGLANLVAAMDRECPGSHLTFISSAAVYAPSTGPLTEDSPTTASSIYAASKLAAEKICDWRAATGGPVAVIRCFNLIGPSISDRQAPGEFAQAAVAARLNGLDQATVRVRDASIRRDFTDLRDAGRAVAAASAGRLEGTFNLCSGLTVSLAELARLTAEAMPGEPFDLRLEAKLAPRPGDPDEITGDASRLRDATGWSPRLSARESTADHIAGLYTIP